ncbi:hypothetical protein [Stutzerimonas kunmingensis]|uniref:hypothetical protein n=1 Tax=Stutzerimonas kunmingensis TaxID=1211807 RepID=UPI0035AF07F2
MALALAAAAAAALGYSELAKTDLSRGRMGRVVEQDQADRAALRGAIWFVAGWGGFSAVARAAFQDLAPQPLEETAQVELFALYGAQAAPSHQLT